MGQKQASDCQTKLWLALVNEDIDAFAKTLQEKDCDPDHVYMNCNRWRILDLVGAKLGYYDYAECIIKAGANINRYNPVTRIPTIHYAAESGNGPVLKILLKNGADVNVQDYLGDTVLHNIVKRWEDAENYRECLTRILKLEELELNVPNAQGYTAIHLAAELGKRKCVELLLEKGYRLDLDSFHVGYFQTTARDELKKTFSEFRNLPPVWGTDVRQQDRTHRFRLFYMISKEEEDRFCDTFEESLREKDSVHDLINICDGNYTYLQHACKMGFKRAARMLMEYGADVNLAINNSAKPVILTASQGHHEILSLLLSKDNIDLSPQEDGQTVLHAIFSVPPITPGHSQCLKILLSKQKSLINQPDVFGQTPLHWAVKSTDESSLLELLNNGAFICARDQRGDCPLTGIPSSTLKKYLDSKISDNGRLPAHEYYALNFDYKFLVDHLTTPEPQLFRQDPLFLLSQSPDLRHLLAHPIFVTIIFLKWQKIRAYFYTNLLFYALFSVIQTSYITLNGSQNALRIILPLFILALVVREVFQVIVIPKQYFINFENYIEIVIIILSIGMMGTDSNELSAIAILLTWFEFFFTVGKHPKLTSYIDMFKTVTIFLFKFLLVHTCLIMAFALSFYTLFRDAEGVNPFATILHSIFKTTVMFAGEFDVGDIPFSSQGWTGHLIFVAFMFLIAIVLFNLLIGLAVSATRPIEDDALLYRSIAQIQIIFHFQDVLFNEGNLVKKYFQTLRLFRHISESITFFPTTAEYKLSVFIHLKNRICFYDALGAESKVIPTSYHLDPLIVQVTEGILSNKRDNINKTSQKIDYIIRELEFQRNLIKECRNDLKILDAAQMKIKCNFEFLIKKFLK